MLQIKIESNGLQIGIATIENTRISDEGFTTYACTYHEMDKDDGFNFAVLHQVRDGVPRLISKVMDGVHREKHKS